MTAQIKIMFAIVAYLRIPLLALLGFAFYTTACTAQVPIREVRLSDKKVVLLLDSTAAALAITTDPYDHYFDLVTAAEMSIQMKRPLTGGESRSDLLPAYLEFLKTDVSSFDLAESKFVAEVLNKAYRTVQAVAPGIFPDTLRLIKTKGTHYGDGVWYTRGNCIIVPANEVEAKKTNPFTTTVFHELFHVYSRLNPARSAELYRLIGFTGMNLEQLRLPTRLAERVLYNPDGVNFAQRITLQQPDGSRVEAIPIIYSKHLGLLAGQNEFFGYVEFNLFPITANADSTWQVGVKDDGYSSPLQLDSQPDFFQQIKDNTGYIIHPDEVLADNFSFLMVEHNSPLYTQKFSPAGKKLLADMKAILQKK